MLIAVQHTAEYAFWSGALFLFCDPSIYLSTLYQLSTVEQIFFDQQYMLYMKCYSSM